MMKPTMTANVMALFQAMIPIIGFDPIDATFDWGYIFPFDDNQQDMLSQEIRGQVLDIGY